VVILTPLARLNKIFPSVKTRLLSAKNTE